jgi:copper homeostasis protein
MTIEVCVDSPDQAVAAKNYGARRVELCSALEIGGLTPSLGLVRKCSVLKGPKIHAMIRPRGGDFSYSKDELDVMKFDIESFANSGVSGVVFGILTNDSNLDIGNNHSLLQIAKSFQLEVTFHRAFDHLRNPLDSLEQIIEIGFDRILTSGQKPKAIDGINMIEKMVSHARGRIQIMAGSGINHKNAGKLQKTGIDALHFTARKLLNDPSGLGMGGNFVPDESKIRSILEALE